jgi:ABC-2 type transport system permease protein
VARRLIWLKWRLLVNGVRHDRQRAVGLPLLALVVLGGGWWAATTYREQALGLPPVAAGEFSLWVMTLGWLVWITLPVLLFPVDEPLEPARFALLPLTRPNLMSGLAGSGLVTVTVLVPLFVLGANLAVFSSPAAILYGLVASTVLLLLLVVAGQAFTALVSMGLQNRRGRDVVFVMVASIGLTAYVLQQAITRRVDALGLAGAVQDHGLSSIAVLLPPAAAQQSIVAADAGDLLSATIHLGASLLWLVALTLVWYGLLDRLLTRPVNSLLPARHRETALIGRGGRWSPGGVIIRKEFRFYRRDPRMRMVWTGGAIFLGILAASVVLGNTQFHLVRRLPWLTLAGPLIVLFIGLPITLNQFGWERNAASFLFALPMSPRTLLLGKNVAVGGGLLLEAAVMSLALAAVSDGWAWLPWAFPVAACAILSQLAVGNLVSVLAPLRLPAMRTDLFSQATEQGCLAIFSQAASFFLIGLALLPAAFSFLLAVDGAIDPILASLGAVAWGSLVYWAGLTSATSLLARRIPEIVQAVQTS